jgi:hypothetical protein
MTEPDAYQYGDRLVSHDMLLALPQVERDMFLWRLAEKQAARLKGKPAHDIAAAVRDFGSPIRFNALRKRAL